MKKVSLGLFSILIAAGFCFSQVPNLCGAVTDSSGNPLADVVVRLGQTTYDSGYGQAPYLVSTDANGHYQLGTGTCIVNTVIPKSTLPSGEAFSRPMYVGGKILFSLPQATASVRMSMYDLSGRFVRDVMNKTLSKGNYSVSIDSRGMSSQFYLLRVTVNGSANVMKVQPGLHALGGDIVRGDLEYQARLEKLAAVVDTLHVTLPGYAIRDTAITTLSGQFNFVLKKNTTWNGDTNAFWGSGYPVATSGLTYVILNRTNGVWADSQIYWSNQQSGTKVRLDKQSTVSVSGGGRFYVWIDPVDSNSRYFDFIEYSVGTGTIAGNNTTRVDGWRLPLQYRIHLASGVNYTRGDVYEMFYQPRQAKFDEFVNEVPKEFTGLATHDFANIWAPLTSPVNYFSTGGPYANYFVKYEDSVVAHQTGAPAVDANAADILGCAGPFSGSPTWGGNYNRHVGTFPQASWCDSTKFYRDYPCNYYSKWCHKRALGNVQYGFPYDDDCNQSGIVGGVSNVQWFGIAIGW